MALCEGGLCCPARAGETEAQHGKCSRNPGRGDLFGERREREEGDGAGGSWASPAAGAQPQQHVPGMGLALLRWHPGRPHLSLPLLPSCSGCTRDPPHAAAAPQRAPRFHGPALLVVGKDAAPQRVCKPHPSSRPALIPATCARRPLTANISAREGTTDQESL